MASFLIPDGWQLSAAQTTIEAVATLAFALSGVLVAALQWSAPPWLALALGAAGATLLRALALAFDWRLPAWSTGEDDDDGSDGDQPN